MSTASTNAWAMLVALPDLSMTTSGYGGIWQKHGKRGENGQNKNKKPNEQYNTRNFIANDRLKTPVLLKFTSMCFFL